MEIDDGALLKEESQSICRDSIGRRDFLFQAVGFAGLAVGAAIGSGVTYDATAKKAPALAPEFFLSLQTRKVRRKAAYGLRLNSAKASYKSDLTPLGTNGDEQSFITTRIGNFSKSLPHGNDGIVDPAAYDALLRACTAGTVEAFEAVPGGPLQLKNPLGGYAYTMEGADPYDVYMPPPPNFASAEMASEMLECYWHAVLRDVAFTDYETDPAVARACVDLGRLAGFRGPRSGGAVTPGTLFRSPAVGATTGPWLSQFLLKDMLFGHTSIPQKYGTTLSSSDYLTNREEWLALQRGLPPSQPTPASDVNRYVINGRDLARLVHMDFPYQLPLAAATSLMKMNAPTNPGDPYRAMRRQCGFSTFGMPHMVESLARVSTLALRTAWRHKWTLHRRTRPEEYAGHVNDYIVSNAAFPIHPDLLHSSGLSEVYARWGSYLLPQAYPEGAPIHPAYPSGHATFVGAGITMVKAFFDERFVIPDPVVPSPDGQSLVPYVGPPLTVGGELNKLAGNVAFGRNFGGVHWRSDAVEGNLLGERVAIALMRDLRGCYMEPVSIGFTSMEGAPVHI